MTWKLDRLAAAALLAALLAAPGARAESAKPSATPVEVIVPIAPAAVPVGGALRLF